MGKNDLLRAIATYLMTEDSNPDTENCTEGDLYDRREDFKSLAITGQKILMHRSEARISKSKFALRKIQTAGRKGIFAKTLMSLCDANYPDQSYQSHRSWLSNARLGSGQFSGPMFQSVWDSSARDWKLYSL